MILFSMSCYEKAKVMKIRGILIIIAIVFLIPCFFFSHLIASTNVKKTLKRNMDPVVITGDQCLNIVGQRISNYGLYSLKKGKLLPIPFQIDEINDKGLFVLTREKGKTYDRDKRYFDLNDQLVFMARDTGDRIKDTSILKKVATACIEITIIDPITSEEGWVYLVTSQILLSPSTVDYTNYDHENMQVVALNYITKFNKKFPVVAAKYAFWKNIGGDGTDLIDRVKVRITMKKIFTMKRTEEDIKVKEIGYIDGPVRVIIHTANTTPLILGIPASKTRQNTLYYYAHTDFPFVVHFPVTPSQFNTVIIDDFINCRGWTFYSSTNPGGHILDGVMDESDKQLDLSPWDWSVITNGKLSFWSRCIYPPKCPVKAYLYFKDDMDIRDKLEDITGELPGLGYDFKEGWDKVTDTPIEFRLIHFYTKAYIPGNEKEIINVHDHPLKISVKKII